MLTIYSVETDEDINLVRGLLEEYVSSWFEFDGPVHENEIEAFRRQSNNLSKYFGPPDGGLLLAKYRKESAGCVALKKLSDGVCEMKRLYVRDDFRGLKIGKALTQEVIEQTRTIGYQSMKLDTNWRLAAATGLYVSLGFKEIEPYEENPLDGAVFMELELM